MLDQDLSHRIVRVREILHDTENHGARPEEITAAERRLDARFGDDLRQLVSAFDGSNEGTPIEHGWITFWPLSAWKRVSDDSQTSRDSGIPDGLLFADHSLDCWWYAARKNPGGITSSIYIVTGAGPERLVADSVSHFLQAIIDDSEALYRGVSPNR